jgi:hypothetical protein
LYSSGVPILKVQSCTDCKGKTEWPDFEVKELVRQKANMKWTRWKMEKGNFLHTLDLPLFLKFLYNCYRIIFIFHVFFS